MVGNSVFDVPRVVRDPFSFYCNRSESMARQALERPYLSSYWDKIRQNERSIGGYVSTILPDFISRGAKDGRSFN